MASHSGAALRVLWGDDDGPDDRAAQLIADNPKMAWRLREFFLEWFKDRYLVRRSSETERNYLSSIRYWEAITDDWRLADYALDDDAADGQAIDFTEQLPEWGFCRRGIRRGQQIRIGRLTENPSFTQLSATTAAEHASRIANLFRKAGPERDNRHRFARLLPRAPIVEVIPADFAEKEPFAWATARQIAAACQAMTRPVGELWLPPGVRWKARLALLYYTGLRMGTVVRLAWPHVSELAGPHPWLTVPKELVKTRKAIEMPLHPQLAEILRDVHQRLPTTRDDLILPRDCVRRTELDLHYELQELAGVPLPDRQGLHAWRRTHLTQIYELGAGRGLEAAQHAADHSDGRTTAKNYVATIVNHFRLRLPALF